MARQPNSYYRPQTEAEAVRLISQPHLSTTLLSGGALRLASLEAPEYEAVVDLQDISELRAIRGLDTGGFSLGANVTLLSVSEHPQMPPLLRQVVGRMLPPVKRRMITVGEAVELAPGVPEVIAALLALDAVVVFALPEEYRLALSEMGLTVEQPRLPRKGLIVALELPEAPGQVWGEAHVARTPADEAIVSAMVVLDVARPGIVRAARVALCGVWPEPARLAESAGLLVGQALTDDQIERVAAGIQAEVDPVEDYRGSVEYRRTMASVLTRRALRQARERLARRE